MCYIYQVLLFFHLFPGRLLTELQRFAIHIVKPNRNPAPDRLLHLLQRKWQRPAADGGPKQRHIQYLGRAALPANQIRIHSNNPAGMMI